VWGQTTSRVQNKEVYATLFLQVGAGDCVTLTFDRSGDLDVPQQWSFYHGNTAVCAASVIGQMCYKHTNNNYQTAVATCQGARLCANDEVQQ
jgi:hypothetical protein